MTRIIHIMDKNSKGAQIMPKVFNRSVSDQIKYWAEIGKLVEDNPDFKL